MSNNVAARQQELKNQHESIITQLDTLKQIEDHMYSNIQSMNNDVGDNTVEVDKLKEKIKKLVDVRKGLFSQLNNMYSYEQKILEKNRRNYVNQTAMASVLDLETGNLRKKYEEVKTDKLNRARMVEIGNYEYDRYDEHKKIFQKLTYAAVIVLVFVILKKRPWFPSFVSTIGIILTIAITLVNLSSQLFFNFFRNERNYNKLDVPYNEGIKDSKYEGKNGNNYKCNEDGCCGTPEDCLEESFVGYSLDNNKGRPSTVLISPSQPGKFNSFASV
tara:strand:- start:2482 stop:3303 length:822 start_codon:yes stop_codon:yes gene_type:complete